MTPTEAMQAVEALRSAFPSGRKADGETLTIYARALEPYDRSVVALVVEELPRELDWFPSLKALVSTVRARGGGNTPLAQALGRDARQDCDLCRGAGWLETEPCVVAPCRCRWLDGGPVPMAVVRAGLPEAVQDRLQGIEEVLGAPVCVETVRMVQRDVMQRGEATALQALDCAIRIYPLVKTGEFPGTYVPPVSLQDAPGRAIPSSPLSGYLESRDVAPESICGDGRVVVQGPLPPVHVFHRGWQESFEDEDGEDIDV